MAIHGVRYALDKDTLAQYRVTFNNGQIVDFQHVVPGPDQANVQAFYSKAASGTLTLIDDNIVKGKGPNGAPTNVRPIYTIATRVGANNQIMIDRVVLGAQGALEPMPPQHGMFTADMARNLFPPNQPGRQQQPNVGPAPRPRPQPQPRPQPKPPMQRQPGSILEQILGNNTGNDSGTQIPTNPDVKKPGMPKTNTRKTISDTQLEQALTAFGKDLTALAAAGDLDPVFGREDDSRNIRQFLLRKKRSSVMLLGEAGVGKTVLVDALAQDIADGKAEAELSDARVISLDLQGMNAGAKFRGEFEKKLMPILKGLDERGGYHKGRKVVLFIDEIHSALTAGQAQGGTNAGQIMKPYLSGGNLTVIGATTPEEFTKHLEKDKALTRRFQPYTIDAPEYGDTLKIMQGAQKGYSEYHAMDDLLSEEMLRYIIRMTDRFMANQQQPDKSVAIMDDALAIARADERTAVTESDVVLAVSKATGLKVDFLNQKDFEIYETLADRLKERVMGQDAVEDIADALITSRVGLTRDDAPRGVFLLPGPTGVGKTELAKALAELLTGDQENLIRIDMSKYNHKQKLSGLVGSPPGFVGSDDGGELTEPVRKKPYSIVLLDEIEKADKEIFNILLPIFDDGETTDAKNRKVDFRNTIFLMTSNLGATAVQRHLSGENVGFKFETTGVEDKKSKDEVQRIVMGEIKKFFKPEVLNRIDGVYPFNALPKPVVSNILDLRLKNVEKNLQVSGNGLQLENVSLEIGADVKAELIEKGYDRAMGARPLDRAINKNLTNKLALWMLKNKDMLVEKNKKGAFKIVVNALGDEFNPKVVAKRKSKQKAANDDVATPVAVKKPKPPANN